MPESSLTHIASTEKKGKKHSVLWREIREYREKVVKR